MNVKFEKAAILEGLQKVQSIVNPRTTLPVLSNILIEAKENRLWLTSTDLEVSVRTAIEAEVIEEGATTLPVKKIVGIFRELPAMQIEIETDESDITSIQCGSSFFKLIGISDEDFPPMPAFDAAKTYSMDQGVFKEMLQKTAYAASTDETRYVLNGVLLTFQGEKLSVVATDGRRLALVEQEVEFPAEAEADFVIPSKTVAELMRTLQDAGNLKIQASDNQISFHFDEMFVVSKLIEGTFPNFRQVVPNQDDYKRVPIEREAFLTAVRRVALMASDQASSIKLTFASNQLVISTETPEIGEARETIPVKYDENEVAIAFNPGFLMDPLRNLESDEVYLEMSDELSPGVLKTNVPFLYVIMPMRIT